MARSRLARLVMGSSRRFVAWTKAVVAVAYEKSHDSTTILKLNREHRAAAGVHEARNIRRLIFSPTRMSAPWWKLVAVVAHLGDADPEVSKGKKETD